MRNPPKSSTSPPPPIFSPCSPPSPPSTSRPPASRSSPPLAHRQPSPSRSPTAIRRTSSSPPTTSTPSSSSPPTSPPASIPTPYAHGVLVLWARKDSPAQPLTLDVLTSPKVQKIAIANGLHAPYGFAADKALASLGLTDKVAGKLVVAENIAQTAQFAESGNAQVGLISLTIASSPHFRDLGTFVRFPPQSYPEIRQCAVILKSSKNQEEAQKFLDWLTSKQRSSKAFTKFGLDPAN